MELLDAIVLIAIALTVGAGTLAGGRLMLLARRIHGLPETVLGLGLYPARLRRREVLGLADPVVTNRFLVWGVGSTMSAAIVMGLVIRSLQGMGFSYHDPAYNLLVAVAGVVSSVCWTLAFRPPRSYLRWLSERYVSRG